MNYRIIFDNDGGITLQLGDDFARFYRSPERAAEDLKDFLADPDTSDWEGHEDEAMACEPTAEEIRKGSYRVCRDVDDLNPDSGWRNEEDFCAAFQD